VTAAAVEYDVFVSYARNPDLERVRELKRALEGAGLRVWLDEVAIERFADITEHIVRGLGRSRALLVYYSRTYLERKACQWELTAALVATQRGGCEPSRILVVNPEPTPHHIYPEHLRGALYLLAPAGPDGVRRVAATVAGHVSRWDGPLAVGRALARPPWYPVHRGQTRFIGRVPDIFTLNRALHQGDHPGTSGYFGPRAAQVVGLGGIGKTALAAEYALRFGAAYPGGIFWLSAPGDDLDEQRHPAEQRTAALVGQLRAIADTLGVAVREPTVEAIRGRLGRAIELRGEPCLWVVDDVPCDLTEDQAREWFAPHPLAYTLLTTRSRRHEALAVEVPLGVMPRGDAYDLLTARRRPEGDAERLAARRLAEDLGRHALALHVAGAALRLQAGLLTFEEFRAELSNPDQDALALADQLARDLPPDHRRSIAGILLRSLGRLPGDGQDLVLLASSLASRPIPASFVAEVLGRADGLPPGGARQRAARAFAQAQMLSLADADDGGGWTVHVLISRAVRHHHGASERRRHLRSAAAAVLTEKLRTLAGAGAAGALEPYAAHARELVSRARNRDEAELLRWVARYDLAAGDFASERSGRTAYTPVRSNA
jgi:hypothetical protein